MKKTPKIFWFADSGIESSTTAAFEDHLHGNRGVHSCDDDDESPPSLDTAIQRLAETIKEFDVHSGVSNGNGHDKNHVTHDFKAEEFFPKEKTLTNGNNRVSGKNGNSKMLGKNGHANGNGQNGHGTKEKIDTNGNGSKLFGRNGNGKQPLAKDAKSEKSMTKEKAKTNGSICGTGKKIMCDLTMKMIKAIIISKIKFVSTLKFVTSQLI